MKLAVLTGRDRRHLLLVRRLQECGHELIVLAETRRNGLNEVAFSTTESGALLSLHSASLRAAQEQLFSAGDDDAIETAIVPVEPGAFKDATHLQTLRDFRPDLVVTYGCGIVGSPILGEYAGSVLGSHQGLPQYYRGSGSNFFAVLDGAICRMGISIHLLDEGIDSGRVVVQAAPAPNVDDTYYTHSARLIQKTIESYVNAVTDISRDGVVRGDSLLTKGRLCQRKDFTPERLIAFYRTLNLRSFYGQFAESAQRYCVQLLGAYEA